MDEMSCQCCVCGNEHQFSEGTSTLGAQLAKAEERIAAQAEARAERDAEVSALRDVARRLVDGVAYWATQEDGIPDFIDDAWNDARALLEGK